MATWQNPTPVCTAPGDQVIDVVISDGEGIPIIATAGLSTQNPDVFQDADGNYWGALEGNEDIYVQKLSPTGQRLFGDDSVAVCTAEGEQHLTSICSSNGGAIVVWGDLRTSPSHSYTLWGDAGIVYVKGSMRPQFGSIQGHMTKDGNGGFVFFYDEGGYYRANQIDSLGNLLWVTSNLPLTLILVEIPRFRSKTHDTLLGSGILPGTQREDF
jgi:hypothetical protein